MNLCKQCGERTHNDKFCSRSCAAKFNNKGVRRNGNALPKNPCLNCGKIIVMKSKAKTINKKFCDQKCKKEHTHKTAVKIWKETGVIDSRRLKQILIEETGNVCSVCGIKDWNGNPIVMDLEHKDGNSGNNNKSNVCLLCPNCHSQTDTFKGKNKGNGRHNRRERYAEGKSY